MMLFSLMPIADDEVFIDKSQPELPGMRSWRRWVLVPSYRKGTAKAPPSVPTTQPDEFTPWAWPRLVPDARGIATIPFWSDQMNGMPEPWLNILDPTT